MQITQRASTTELLAIFSLEVYKYGVARAFNPEPSVRLMFGSNV